MPGTLAIGAGPGSTKRRHRFAYARPMEHERPRRRRHTDVVVLGGGIIGCSAAAIMADRGASVTLVEGSAIGAGASGRNLGAIQHPFDPVLAPVYRETTYIDQAIAFVDAVGAGDAFMSAMNLSSSARASCRARPCPCGFLQRV